MIRICTSLVQQGYRVKLIGVKNLKATLLTKQPYKQKRLHCFFEKGFGFYAEYNIRLFIYLLFVRAHVFCCVDVDTMLPVYLVGKLRGKKLVYDAHEYFSQQKEVLSRPKVYKVWHWIERTFIPKFKNGYTVSEEIANEFKKLYRVDYGVIMNATVLKNDLPVENNTEIAFSPAKAPLGLEAVILYQGAVNHARGFEQLIPAMQNINAQLHIYGDGNFYEEAKQLINENNLQDNVFLKGKLLPHELAHITQQATIGINLVENNGLNQYYSLANKFFDYIHAGLPQITMNFPAYNKINSQFEVAILLDDLKIETIAKTINELLNNKEKYTLLQNNCVKAKEQYNWQIEEKKLIEFYERILPQI
ncbi:MAG: glycosyltransferase [Ferruginibacter sp.]|nr:glycosyltransferase [Ferruginibacter sp.]